MSIPTCETNGCTNPRRKAGKKASGEPSYHRLCGQCYYRDNQDKERARNQTRRRRGREKVDIATLEDLRRLQNDRCAICGSAPGARALHVDHDHRTGQTRGLLCHSCNIGLGMFRDSPVLLRGATAYLKVHGID